MATNPESETAAAPSSSNPVAGPTVSAAASSASVAKTEQSASPTPKDKEKGNDQSDSVETGSGAIAGRTSESFKQYMISEAIFKDQSHSQAILQNSDRQKKLTEYLSGKTNDYRLVRGEYNRWFPPSRLYGEGYSGYGNGRTEIGQQARLVYPSQKPRLGKRTTPVYKWSRKEMKQQAEQHEELVPIRLDVDWETIKLRDTFTWNLHDRITNPKTFAAQLVEDMGLIPPVAPPVIEQALHQMTEQLNDFYPFVFSDEDALDPELPYSAYKNDEMRILVKLNITIGQHTLVDQFEWDINNPQNSPEDFAASMSRELSLSGEFTTAIAHCIREQIQLFTRSLYSIGHPFDGRPIEDPDLVTAFLPSPLPSVFRPQQQAKEYAPYLYELTEADLERNEVIFQREQRRQKRSVNRRGGPSLPDLKERQRTIRTLVVSSTLPGAALEVEDSRLYKRVAGAGRGKRGGARDGEISDSEESDDSSPDSPAASQLAGTARTRGMRGAASAAQQRMATIGRSETPEATIHHHETRTSRRFGRELTREDTEEPQHLVVTLKVNKDRLRKLVRDQKLKQHAAASGSQTPSQPHTRIPSVPVQSNMPPPSSTPKSSNASIPGPGVGSFNPALASPSTSTLPAGQLGRIEAPPPPPDPAVPPPSPPAWLVAALEQFKQEPTYANDLFEGTMRYIAVDSNTGAQVPMPPQDNVPAHVKFYYLPRIRCIDCPGKLYTPGPEMTAGNFEVHLKNRSHREKVDARVARERGQG